MKVEEEETDAKGMREHRTLELLLHIKGAVYESSPLQH